MIIIDGCQYASWSEQIFQEMKEGGVSAVHVTVTYHEDFRETVENIADWNRLFERFSNYILPGRTVEDVYRAQMEQRTAIIFGFQNPSPIEDDIGLIEIWSKLGIKFMQLTYNNQSLLATGCYEKNDTGITRMGREVIGEMNRVGMVIDMSHSAEKSTLEAIEFSSRPISITHANPSFWHPAHRNKSETVLKELSKSNGMIGFSLYPHHLKKGTYCKIEDFCKMIAKTAEKIGTDNIGIGSDLCQDQPDYVVEWMRNGRWTKSRDFGEGSSDSPGFPDQPSWFQSNKDFKNIIDGLDKIGFSKVEISNIMGKNWLNFFEASFSPG